MVNDFFLNNSLKQFTWHRSKRDGSVVRRVTFFALFVDGGDICKFPSRRDLTSEQGFAEDYLEWFRKMMGKIFEDFCGNSIRAMG